MAIESFNTDFFNDSFVANQLLGTGLPPDFPNAAGSDVYVGLSSTVPSRTKASNAGTNWNVTEPIGNGYLRRRLSTANGGNFKTLGPGVYTAFNNSRVEFPLSWAAPTGAWGTTPLISFCFFTDTLANGGNLLHVDTRFIQPRWINQSVGRLILPDNFLNVGFQQYGKRRAIISEYYAQALIAYCYANGALPTPTIYLALCTQAPLPTDTGSTITEVSGGSYARVAVPGWTKIKPGIYGNSSPISFTTATDVWGTVNSFAICDALTAGNVLWSGIASPPTYADSAQPFPDLPIQYVQIGLGQ